MTELEKMYGGMIFDSHDPELAAELKRSRRLCDRYNALSVDDEEERLAILKELFGTEDFGDFRAMERPMYIDNGRDITIGKNFYSNLHFHFSGGKPGHHRGQCDDRPLLHPGHRIPLPCGRGAPDADR